MNKVWNKQKAAAKIAAAGKKIFLQIYGKSGVKNLFCCIIKEKKKFSTQNGQNVEKESAAQIEKRSTA